MTVSSSADRATFPGNGVAVGFPLPFRFFANSDIQVGLLTNATGVLTPLTLGVHYSLIGASLPEQDGNAESVLTMFVAPAIGFSLFVQRVIPLTQPTDIVNQGRFFPETHEDVFDRLTMLVQQTDGNSRGAIRVAIGDPEPLRLPPAQSRANQLMGFNSLGNPIAVSPVNGSIDDFAIRLADSANPTLGAAMVGYKGRTVADKLNNEVNILDFSGADPTGVADSTAAIVSALASLGNRGTLYIPTGTYKTTSTIVLPQNSNIRVRGDGFRQSTIAPVAGSGFAAFSYARASGQGGSVFIFEDLRFEWKGTAKLAGSVAVKSFGFSDANSDNWVRIYRCGFHNFERSVYLKWSGQCYLVDNYHQGNKYSYYLERGASFLYMRGVMSFDDTLVFADDPIGDAFSNGIVLENCNNITASMENMYVNGWQAVFIAKCGFDLGSGGSYALWFKNCQDVYIDSCFISSNGSTTRGGINFDATHSFGVSKCTLVNNNVGIRTTFPAFSQASKGTITGNRFAGNDKNDVLITDNCECVKVTENHFEKQMSRTGTNFEIYANQPGSNNHIIKFNTFRGASYVISAGANSIVGENIFNTKV